MGSAVRIGGNLRVEDRKRGPRTWVATIVAADGSRTSRVLGPAWVKDSGKRTARGAVVWRAAPGSKPDHTYLTPREADDALNSILATERAKPAARKQTRGKTWGDAARGWLDDAETRRAVEPTTLNTYKSTVNRLREEGLSDDLPLRQVTAKRIEGTQDKLLRGFKLPSGETRKLSRTTVHHRMTIITGVLAWAQRRGWIGSNPADDASLIPMPATASDFHVLEPSQVEAVARAVHEIPDDELPMMRNGKLDKHALATTQEARAMWSEIIRVAAYTGLRFGELRALRWRDVDFVGQAVRIVTNLPGSSPKNAKPTTPKGKKAGSVPLIDPAVAALDRVSKLGNKTGPNDLVFPNLKGGMQDSGRVRDAFYEALARADLGHLREQARPIVFHDLRHTFGTIAVRAFPVSDVQAFMRHKDITTTMRYVHHVPRTDAARQLTEAFAADLNGNASPAKQQAVSD